MSSDLTVGPRPELAGELGPPSINTGATRQVLTAAASFATVAVNALRAGADWATLKTLEATTRLNDITDITGHSIVREVGERAGRLVGFTSLGLIEGDPDSVARYVNNIFPGSFSSAEAGSEVRFDELPVRDRLTYLHAVASDRRRQLVRYATFYEAALSGPAQAIIQAHTPGEAPFSALPLWLTDLMEDFDGHISDISDATGFYAAVVRQMGEANGETETLKDEFDALNEEAINLEGTLTDNMISVRASDKLVERDDDTDSPRVLSDEEKLETVQRIATLEHTLRSIRLDKVEVGAALVIAEDVMAQYRDLIAKIGEGVSTTLLQRHEELLALYEELTNKETKTMLALHGGLADSAAAASAAFNGTLVLPEGTRLLPHILVGTMPDGSL